MYASHPTLPHPIAAWAGRDRGSRLARLDRTPRDLQDAIAGHDPGTLARPSPDEGWAAVHVLGHVRDVEDLSLLRFRMMLRMDDPSVPAAGMPDDPLAWGLIEDGAWLFDPERWAADRQYARDDPVASAGAFERNRRQTLAFLGRLGPDRWSRGSIHPLYGRLTFDDWTAILAWHDDNHLAQLERILAAAGSR
jgi:hypothetical protein